MITAICYLVTLFACLLGTICGMGGGIIIKPVLDATGVMSVSLITFLSGLTVIAMTCWNLGKNLMKKDSVIDLKYTTFLAISAAIGGLLGKGLYNLVASLFDNKDTAGGIQALLLMLATLATLIYTNRKDAIKTHQIDSIPFTLLIGFILGVFGAFLGIGGGPFNVAILYYFFNMQTKQAAQNSLYIILFSQVASTSRTIIRSGIPEFDLTLLLGMILFAIIGNEIGRRINQRIDNEVATKLFKFSMILIIVINIYNICKFLL